ncbi:30S ribosomal protein S2 [Alphaproteobacteria bacterium]
MQFYQRYYTMQQLFEAGVHYGHRKDLWNPQMEKYVYGIQNGVHIIDLQQTVIALEKALNALRAVASQNGRILFVCTKKHVRDVVAESAQRCGQYYTNYRWLGGTLTNWVTISASLKKLKEYKAVLNDEKNPLIKKERLFLKRKCDKLENVLGGIYNMGGVPDMVFVIGTNASSTAVEEARKLGISVCAIVDTNCDPTKGIDYVIPGNDDARRSIELYCKLAADAVLVGIQESLQHSGVDMGAVQELHKTGFIPRRAKGKMHNMHSTRVAECAIQSEEEKDEGSPRE